LEETLRGVTEARAEVLTIVAGNRGGPRQRCSLKSARMRCSMVCGDRDWECSRVWRLRLGRGFTQLRLSAERRRCGHATRGGGEGQMWRERVVSQNMNKRKLNTYYLRKWLFDTPKVLAPNYTCWHGLIDDVAWTVLVISKRTTWHGQFL